MNESKTSRQQTKQQIHTDNKFRQTSDKQHIQTAEPDSGRQTE
ncbi:hypothetical protein Tco_1526736, partial [Tanacetum coccineum]